MLDDYRYIGIQRYSKANAVKLCPPINLLCESEAHLAIKFNTLTSFSYGVGVFSARISPQQPRTPQATDIMQISSTAGMKVRFNVPSTNATAIPTATQHAALPKEHSQYNKPHNVLPPTFLMKLVSKLGDQPVQQS